MKPFAAILGLLACAALMAVAPPRPKTPTIVVSVRTAAGLVWVKWAITANGAPDSVKSNVVWHKTPLTDSTTVKRYLAPSVIADSMSFPKPGFSATVSGTVDAKSFRRALSATAAAKTWSYTSPPDTAPPVPTVDSVRVTPTSASLTPGGTVLLTARVYRS